jgi:uncharacterized protein HemX
MQEPVFRSAAMTATLRAFVIAFGLAAAFPTAAAAQSTPLPSTSRAERQIIENNRSLDLQQQQRGYTQQNQFEINQLRNQIQRDQMAPPPGRGCVTGAGIC